MIQIDIPMPKCCRGCIFASADYSNGIISLSCNTPTGRSMYAPDLIYRKDRPEWCPLKEQEAVSVVQREFMHLLVWCCGSCGVAITHGDKFCRNCGQVVKWNE